MDEYYHQMLISVLDLLFVLAERELDLYHIPDDTPFSVSVNIDYFSVGMDFSTCCNDYSYT